MSQSTVLTIGVLAVLGLHLWLRSGMAFSKRKDGRAEDLREISDLARKFVSRPSMNPEKIKVSAELLGVFLPDKVAEAVIPVAGTLDGPEIGALIGLCLKIVETFYPNARPVVQSTSGGTDVTSGEATTVS